MPLLPDETAQRLASLVLGQGHSIESARRTLAAGSDGGEPTQVSRNGADRAIRTARETIEQGADIPAVAARVLKLLSLELASLEREPGPKDLDRLQKIAQTLSSIERLRPKTGQKEETGLLSLREQDQTTSELARNGTS